MKRREFFTSLIKPLQKEEPRLLYPPYYEVESDFEKCRECESKPCMRVCEEEVIQIVDERPSLDFSKSGCTFCDECAVACELDVLKVEAKRKLPALAIDPVACLAWHGTICSSCRDACLDNAIKFYGLFKPEITGECSGCGFCVAVCPSSAIGMGGEV